MKVTRHLLKAVIGIVGISASMVLHASGGAVHLDHYPGQLCDDASLQRGAGIYVQYCQGCHSLQYMRYKGTGEGIGIVDQRTGEPLEALIQANLNLVSDKVSAPILSAIQKEDSEKWFGITPPDLTLVARVRGNDWLYTYLRTFYLDDSRPMGVNNLVFPDVGMPHVLSVLQGEQKPVFRTVSHESGEKLVESKVLDHLELQKPGLLSLEEYDQLVVDLVNFLDYAAEPVKLERQRMGVWVILFLAIFLVFAVLLKREYWKDIH